jgi:FAD/FMN-containing dehydrogenase
MTALACELRRVVGAQHLIIHALAHFDVDTTGDLGRAGRGYAAVRPGSPRAVGDVLAWSGEHDVSLSPPGGGSGYVGGALPVGGGLVVALDRMTEVRQLAPLQSYAHIEAGRTTRRSNAWLARTASITPPIPARPAHSQIGGTVATNAGGPHAFALRRRRRLGHRPRGRRRPGDAHPCRRSHAQGCRRLRPTLAPDRLQGTLGIVTLVSLKLLPGPEARYPVLAYARARRPGERPSLRTSAPTWFRARSSTSTDGRLGAVRPRRPPAWHGSGEHRLGVVNRGALHTHGEQTGWRCT